MASPGRHATLPSPHRHCRSVRCARRKWGRRRGRSPWPPPRSAPAGHRQVTARRRTSPHPTQPRRAANRRADPEQPPVRSTMTPADPSRDTHWRVGQRCTATPLDTRGASCPKPEQAVQSPAPSRARAARSGQGRVWASRMALIRSWAAPMMSTTVLGSCPQNARAGMLARRRPRPVMMVICTNSRCGRSSRSSGGKRSILRSRSPALRSPTKGEPAVATRGQRRPPDTCEERRS